MYRRLLVTLAVIAACSDEASDGASGDDGGASSSSGQAGTSSSGGSSGTSSSGSSGTSSSSSGGSSGTPGQVRRPPVNGKFDYQIGGDYPPPAGVEVVSRDRKAAPATGLYSICYVNGFQIQPEELADWTANRPDLILKGTTGEPIIDEDWNEALIDVSTAAKREAVLAVVGAWMDDCAARGFQAIEIDNLDSFSRSQGRLTEDDGVAMMKLFAVRAHGKGLAIAQKNGAELVPRKTEMGTDFVVAEECNRYTECEDYRAGYGDDVIVIEYRREDFDAGCRQFPNLSIVLRDRDVLPAGKTGYVYDGC